MAEDKKTSKKADSKDKSAKTDKAKKRKNPFKSIGSFFKSVKSEGKKVVWAKPKEVLRNTLIVIVVCAIVGVCIYAVDTGLSLGMKGLKNLADSETTTTSQTADDETTTADSSADETETSTQAAE